MLTTNPICFKFWDSNIGIFVLETTTCSFSKELWSIFSCIEDKIYSTSFIYDLGISHELTNGHKTLEAFVL